MRRSIRALIRGNGPTRFIPVFEDRTASRTATAAPGGTTGVIAGGTEVVIVTSVNANNVITLPDADLGFVLTILPVAANGYELRTHAPATVGINDGRAANAESAIAIGLRVICHRTETDNWVCSNTAADGTVTVTEVAA